MSEAVAAPQGRFFQLGYVCTRLEPAMEEMTGRGAGGFLVIDVAADMGVPDAPVRRIALGYLADLMIEIIETDPTIDSVFLSALPGEGEAMRLHHFGYLFDDKADWTLACSAAGQASHPVTAEERAGVLSYAYVDRRGDFGHFLELIHLEEGGNALFAAVPSMRLSVR